MEAPFGILKFKYAYDLAGRICQLILENREEEYLADYFQPNDEDFQRRIAIPQKDTLLHDFIKIYWQNDIEEAIDHNGDIFLADYLEELLKTYGVNIEMSRPKFIKEHIDPNKYSKEIEEMNKYLHHIRSKPKCNEEIFDFEKYNDDMDEYLNYLESLIGSIKEFITKDTFYLLFNDRLFLQKFNLIVSEVIKNMKKDDYPEIMKKDGVIVRFESPPVWLKNAVFFRDRGRCQVCGGDLSGLLCIGANIHYDHIVPLDKGGNNDPTNFQILCAEHNLEKGIENTVTSETYQVFW